MRFLLSSAGVVSLLSAINVCLADDVSDIVPTIELPRKVPEIPEPVEAKEQARSDDLTTIIVTGEKMRRSVAETTTSTRIAGSEVIESSGAQALADLFAQTPNVSTGEEGQISIRGIARQGASGDGSPLISLLIDGVSLDAYSLQSTDDLFDVDQVEILRGAQSTSQGRNSLAGAVIINTREPTDYWDARTRLQFGERGKRGYAFAGGGPLGDAFAFRVLASRDEDDGFITHQANGDDRFARDVREQARAKLAFRPFYWPMFESLLTVGANRREGQPDYNIERGTSGTDPAQRRSASVNEETLERNETWLASWRNRFEIGHRWTLTSVSAYLDAERTYNRDYDGLEEEGGYNPIFGQSENFTQELRLNVADIGPLRGVVGVYFGRFKEDESIGSEGVRVPASFLLPLPVGGDAAEVVINFYSDDQRRATNHAAFFEADWSLPWEVTATLGLRYDTETLEFFSAFSTQDSVARVLLPGGLVDVPLGDTPLNEIIDPNSSIPLPIPGSFLDEVLSASGVAPDTDGFQGGKTRYTAWLPKFGLRRQLSERLTVFAQFVRGYRAGGISVDTENGDVIPYDPEYTSNYEIGLRATSLLGRWNGGFNLFFTDWRDQQVTVPRGLFFIIENAGRSRIYGFESNLNYRIWRELQGDFAVGYARTEFVEYETASADYSGNEFVLAPKWTGSLGLRWSPPLGLQAATYLNYRDHAWTRPDNLDDEFSAERALLDARFGWQWRHVGMFLVGRNLTDRDYISETYQFRDGYVGASSPRGYAAYGEPRTIYAQVEARF